MKTICNYINIHCKLISLKNNPKWIKIIYLVLFNFDLVFKEIKYVILKKCYT